MRKGEIGDLKEPARSGAGLGEGEKRLLQYVQDSFPLAVRPFGEVGAALGMKEDEVISELRRLQGSGFIRRIAPMIDVKKIENRVSTLVGMKVPPGDVERVAGIVNGFAQVTHNYERAHEYNLWFTLSEKSAEALGKALDDIRQRTGVKELISLPAVRFFKLGVRFKLE